MSTLRLLPFAPSVLSHFGEKAPYTSKEGKMTLEVTLCARQLLKRIVDNARNDLKSQFLELQLEVLRIEVEIQIFSEEYESKDAILTVSVAEERLCWTFVFTVVIVVMVRENVCR
ncbi:hypothetical protein PQX77_022210 [Marasmius sp. AFHP31]|nr:hypothetical protein PQX77_022210 [Marasmius sp. AFHP31]